MEVRSKKETIDQMVDLMAAGGNIADVDIYREGVYKTEEEGTTGLGEGIAIPHAKTDAVKAPGLAAMVVKEGVDYDSLGWRAGSFDLPDCRAEYRRQCSSGSIEQAFHAADG